MIVLSRNMAYSVAYDVLNEANLLEDSRTQQEKVTDEHNYALREEKVETNSVIALKRTNEPDADDIKRLVNPEVYEFGDPNRYKEINKAFEDLNIALCEMQDALKLIEKPPEACLEEMNKFLQKNCDKLKEMTFVSNKEKERERDKEASKREDSANVASSSSSRVEVDVVVKSPNKKTGKELTENITAGVVVEPQPIEVKKEPKQDRRPLYRRNDFGTRV